MAKKAVAAKGAAKSQEKVPAAVKAAPAAQKSEPVKKAVSASGAGVVQKGNSVKVDYVGSFDDGKVFDASSRSGQPLEFTAGSGQVIPGFDNAVIGMKKGEEKVVKIAAKNAYGEHKPELVKIITRDKLPKDQEPKVGMVLVMGLSNGMEVPAMITKINGDMISLDLNHPLAGKNLNFKITLVDFS